MFTIYCPEHGAQTLVPIDAIQQLENTEDGIRLYVECWCGAHLVINTGQPHHAPVAA